MLKKVLLALFILLTVNQVAFADQKYPELCPLFTRKIGLGDSGNDVKKLQIVLGQEGMGYINATGYFGPVTARAVAKMQKSLGLQQTGGVGPKSLKIFYTLWCQGNNSQNNVNSIIRPVTNQTNYQPNNTSNDLQNTNSIIPNGPVTLDTKVAEQRHRNYVLNLNSCGNGNDFYDGGADYDTIEYRHKREDFIITKHSDGSFTFEDKIPCGSDTDTVVNIERFIFGTESGTNQVIELKDLVPSNYQDMYSFIKQIPVSNRPNTQNGLNSVVSTVDLSVSPTNTTSGQPVTVSWNIKNVNNCSLSENGFKVRDITNINDSAVLYPMISTIYKINCTSIIPNNWNALEQINKEVSVNIPLSTSINPPEITAAKAAPTTVTPGGVTKLSWSTLNATSCSISGGANYSNTIFDNKSIPVNGSIDAVIFEDSIFTVTCKNLTTKSISANIYTSVFKN